MHSVMRVYRSSTNQNSCKRNRNYNEKFWTWWNDAPVVWFFSLNTTALYCI